MQVEWDKREQVKGGEDKCVEGGKRSRKSSSHNHVEIHHLSQREFARGTLSSEY